MPTQHPFWALKYLSVYFSVVAIPHIAINVAGSSHPEDNDGADMWCGLDDIALARSNLHPKDLWPDARVPYQFDKTFGDEFRATFQIAVEHFHNHTCVRWEPKTPQDTGYVFVYATSDNASHCGSATICYTTRRQNLQMRWDCGTTSLMVHEMLHSLCLMHEQSRMDRDEFLAFPYCENPPPIISGQKQTANMYDYYSVMSYGCRGGCDGTPKMSGVRSCGGSQWPEYGLGVLDADKVNQYYNCQGCHAHRWYSLQTMSEEKWSHLLDFSSQVGDIGPVYACRGYGTRGEITPGIFLLAEKLCQITSWEGTVYYVNKHIELFALPTVGSNPTLTKSGDYQLVRYSGHVELDEKHVAAGRVPGRIKRYLAVTTDDRDGVMKTYIGYYSSFAGLAVAFFPHPVHGSFTLGTFDILKCIV